MNTTIGIVTKVAGMAIIVDEQGKRHIVKVGESLHSGEKLITAAGAVVTVSVNDNETVTFKESQTIRLTEQIGESAVTDVSENVVNQAVFQQILTALNAGQDIDNLLDAPAAGGVASDGDTSFVNLDRILTADGTQAFLEGGPRVASETAEIRSIDLRYFPNITSNITPVISLPVPPTPQPPTPEPPPSPPPPKPPGDETKVEIETKSPIVSGDNLAQVGGTINKTDNSTSLINENALIGVLTDSINFTDNSVSLVNTDAVVGVLSGPMTIKDNSTSLVDTLAAVNILSGATSVTDKSTSLVNTGIVAGVLSGDTSVVNQSVSAVNTGVVAGVLSGNTSLTDQSNSLVNTEAVLGVLSGHTSVVDKSNSLVNTNVVGGILSGNTTLTDQSSSLVNAGIVPNVLSGDTVVNDQSTSIANALVAPSVLSGDSTVNENSNAGLLDLAVIPSIMSGSNTVNDNSSSLIDVDVVPGILSDPVSFKDNSSSPIDVDVALNVLDTSGDLLTLDSNIHVDGLLDIGVSLPSESGQFLTIKPAEGDFSSLLSNALGGELLSQVTEDITKQLGTVPDPLAVTSTVLDKTLSGTLNPTDPLSPGDLLQVDNVLDNLPGSLINTTAVNSPALSLVQGPILLNTVTVQQPLAVLNPFSEHHHNFF